MTIKPLWRVGGHNPRTIYRDGRDVGRMDDENHARALIAGANAGGSVEALLAEGRRQADEAIAWETGCVTCAARYTQSRESHEQGMAEMAERIITGLREWGQRDAANLAQQIAAKTTRTATVEDGQPL